MGVVWWGVGCLSQVGGDAVSIGWGAEVGMVGSIGAQYRCTVGEG